jgi:hypothetical protein
MTEEQAHDFLRLHDQAKDAVVRSEFQQECRKADKALQRIDKELKKRNVPH